MKRKLFVISFLLVFVMSIISGCTSMSSKPAESAKPAQSAAPAAPQSSAPASAPAKKAEISLKMGYGNSQTNPRHLAAEQYAKWVNEQTGGKVEIQLFPSEILGTDKQMTESIVMGTLDMHIGSSGVIAAYAPKLAVTELPFLFASKEKIAKVFDGPLGNEIGADLVAKGMRVLAYWENGLRHIANNKKPVEKPEDLKGLKIRAPENKMTIDIFKALGANVAPLAYSETYLAISQGTFDGLENAITSIHSAKMYEVTKYMSITNHKYESCPLVVSEKVWSKLPQDAQKALKEGAVKFAQVQRDMIAKDEDGLLAQIEKSGVKISRPDIKPFQDATKSVYTAWEATLGKDLINKVVEAAK